jgi:hypothetical protein
VREDSAARNQRVASPGDKNDFFKLTEKCCKGKEIPCKKKVDP